MGEKLKELMNELDRYDDGSKVTDITLTIKVSKEWMDKLYEKGKINNPEITEEELGDIIKLALDNVGIDIIKEEKSIFDNKDFVWGYLKGLEFYRNQLIKKISSGDITREDIDTFYHNCYMKMLSRQSIE